MANNSTYACVCPLCGVAHTVSEHDMTCWLSAFGDDTEHVLCPTCFYLAQEDEQVPYEEADWRY